MLEALFMAAILVYVIAIFSIRYFLGERFFWGRKYLEQGYQILLSRRLDAYTFDTIVIAFSGLPVLAVCLRGEEAFLGAVQALRALYWLPLVFLAALLLWGWVLRKTCVFFNDQGLLLVKPFRPLRHVPWSGIGTIQRKTKSAQLYDVLDPNGCRLTWFPLTRKTLPFCELAQQNRVPIHVPRSQKALLRNAGEKRPKTSGEWDAVLARSPYGKHKIFALAEFQDFVVAGFMDKTLNEDNIIAINRDGTVRWKISDIIRQPGPVSYTAMSADTPETIGVTAVLDRQYRCVTYGVDVYQQKVVYQEEEDDA